MGEFSKEELSRIKVKEDANRKEALKNSAAHDAAVIENIKSKFGMGQAAPAPAPQMPQAPAPVAAPQGMKKGGKVAGRLATRGYGIAKSGKK